MSEIERGSGNSGGDRSSVDVKSESQSGGSMNTHRSMRAEMVANHPSKHGEDSELHKRSLKTSTTIESRTENDTDGSFRTAQTPKHCNKTPNVASGEEVGARTSGSPRESGSTDYQGRTLPTDERHLERRPGSAHYLPSEHVGDHHSAREPYGPRYPQNDSFAQQGPGPYVSVHHPPMGPYDDHRMHGNVAMSRHGGPYYMHGPHHGHPHYSNVPYRSGQPYPPPTPYGRAPPPQGEGYYGNDGNPQNRHQSQRQHPEGTEQGRAAADDVNRDEPRHPGKSSHPSRDGNSVMESSIGAPQESSFARKEDERHYNSRQVSVTVSPGGSTYGPGGRDFGQTSSYPHRSQGAPPPSSSWEGRQEHEYQSRIYRANRSFDSGDMYKSNVRDVYRGPRHPHGDYQGSQRPPYHPYPESTRYQSQEQSGGAFYDGPPPYPPDSRQSYQHPPASHASYDVRRTRSYDETHGTQYHATSERTRLVPAYPSQPRRDEADGVSDANPAQARRTTASHTSERSGSHSTSSSSNDPPFARAVSSSFAESIKSKTSVEEKETLVKNPPTPVEPSSQVPREGSDIPSSRRPTEGKRRSGEKPLESSRERSRKTADDQRDETSGKASERRMDSTTPTTDAVKERGVPHPASNASSLSNSPSGQQTTAEKVEKSYPSLPTPSKLASLDSLSSVASIQEPMDTRDNKDDGKNKQPPPEKPSRPPNQPPSSPQSSTASSVFVDPNVPDLMNCASSSGSFVFRPPHSRASSDGSAEAKRESGGAHKDDRHITASGKRGREDRRDDDTAHAREEENRRAPSESVHSEAKTAKFTDQSEGHRPVKRGRHQRDVNSQPMSPTHHATEEGGGKKQKPQSERPNHGGSAKYKASPLSLAISAPNSPGGMLHIPVMQCEEPRKSPGKEQQPPQQSDRMPAAESNAPSIGSPDRQEGYLDKPSYSFSLDSVPSFSKEGNRQQPEYAPLPPRPGSSSSTSLAAMGTVSTSHRTGGDGQGGASTKDRGGQGHPGVPTAMMSWEIQGQDSFAGGMTVASGGSGGGGNGGPLLSTFSFTNDYQVLPRSSPTEGFGTSNPHEASGQPPPPPQHQAPSHHAITHQHGPPPSLPESRNQSFDTGHYHDTIDRPGSGSVEMGYPQRNDPYMSSHGRAPQSPPPPHQSYPPHAPSWGTSASSGSGSGHHHIYSTDSSVRPVRSAPYPDGHGGPSTHHYGPYHAPHRSDGHSPPPPPPPPPPPTAIGAHGPGRSGHHQPPHHVHQYGNTMMRTHSDESGSRTPPPGPPYSSHPHNPRMMHHPPGPPPEQFVPPPHHPSHRPPSGHTIPTAFRPPPPEYASHSHHMNKRPPPTVYIVSSTPGSRSDMQSMAGRPHHHGDPNMMSKSGPMGGVYSWTKEDDMRLTEIMKKYKNPRDWVPIAKEHGRGKSAKECHERWIRYLKPGVRKGQWQDHEDAIVVEAVTTSTEQPFTRWSDLAQRLPGRVGKQIRDRWVNHLNPNINHMPFSREDDLLLWEGHKKLGKRWVEISTKYFNSSRSENHIKNRWYSASFKKFISNEFGPDAYSGGSSKKDKEDGTAKDAPQDEMSSDKSSGTGGGSDGEK